MIGGGVAGLMLTKKLSELGLKTLMKRKYKGFEIKTDTKTKEQWANSFEKEPFRINAIDMTNTSNYNLITKEPMYLGGPMLSSTVQWVQEHMNDLQHIRKNIL